MRILFDRQGLQAEFHLQDKMRLTMLLTELLSAQHWVSFSSGPTLTPEALREADVLVITTRASGRPDVKYAPQELTDITAFVHGGGGLLLLSNHADREGNSFDARQHDAQLTEKFGITLERAFYRHELPQRRTRFTTSEFDADHPIITGAEDDRPVESIITNTYCSITAATGNCIVSLPDDVVDVRGEHSPEGQAFAWALEGEALNSEAKGRVVVVADSGFIGTDMTYRPGPGLLGHGDNLPFVMNMIRWLGRELG